MAVFIADESARAYWDSVESLVVQTECCYVRSLANASATVRSLKGCGIPREAIVGRKLYVFVDDYAKRRRSKHLASRLCVGRLPEGSFRRLSDTVMIASPEFLFMRMAARLSLAATIQLGFELCGTYIVRPADPERNTRKPLTTVNKIRRFLQHAGPLRGSRKALMALDYVVESSNSPMETALAMLLCLPCRYGGFNIPAPQMNYEIKLNAAQACQAGHRVFRCDLYWKDAAFALEYYGRDWHTGVLQVANDARRQGDLQYRGIDVMVVTYEQIDTPGQVAILAGKVAKRLGVRLRKPNDACQRARRNLHSLLIRS